MADGSEPRFVLVPARLAPRVLRQPSLIACNAKIDYFVVNIERTICSRDWGRSCSLSITLK